MGTTRKDDVCPRFRTLSLLSSVRRRVAAHWCWLELWFCHDSALAQDAAPVANAPAANAVTPKPVAQDAAAQPTYSADYDGILYTGEGGTVTLKGTGFTKEWREQQCRRQRCRAAHAIPW